MDPALWQPKSDWRIPQIWMSCFKESLGKWATDIKDEKITSFLLAGSFLFSFRSALPSAHFLRKETVAAIMMPYWNTKVKARSPDGNTNLFDIVASVLQGDILAPYLFIICQDYVQSAENRESSEGHAGGQRRLGLQGGASSGTPWPQEEDIGQEDILYLSICLSIYLSN